MAVLWLRSFEPPHIYLIENVMTKQLTEAQNL